MIIISIASLFYDFCVCVSVHACVTAETKNEQTAQLLIVLYICGAKLGDECWWMVQFVSLGNLCGRCLKYTLKLKDLFLIPSFTQPRAELAV
jgi:hypothetical protein